MFAVYFLHIAAGRHALLGYRVLVSAWRCAIVLFCTLLWLSLLLSLLLLLLLLLLISLHTCTWFPSLTTAEIPVEFSEWINAWNRVSKWVLARSVTAGGFCSIVRTATCEIINQRFLEWALCSKRRSSRVADELSLSHSQHGGRGTCRGPTPIHAKCSIGRGCTSVSFILTRAASIAIQFHRRWKSLLHQNDISGSKTSGK